jgi:outer membrane protein assembly factor BamA/autotransporter translocation and assembly factor TamB
MRRRFLLVCLGLLLLVAIGVLAAHTPMVRSIALRYVLRAAVSQGVQVEAARLDYNLITRTVRLADVKVSAPGDAEAFFVADEVSATGSSRVFFGELVLDEVSIRNGAVHIVRRTDGTTNLPRTSRGGSGDPAPLPITRISAPGLSVVYQDEPADVAIQAPALTVDLSPRGRLSLGAPAELTIGSTSTRIQTLDSDAAFDGRDLRLSGLRFNMPELRAQVDGTLALIRQEPAVDIRISGDSQLENAATWWGQADDPPRGGVHIDGTVSGPLGDPAADLRISSMEISWEPLTVERLEGRLRLDGSGLEFSDSRALIAEGHIDVAGSFAWQSQRVSVKASWNDIDAAELVTALTGADVAPSGRSSGALAASGAIDAIEAWNVDARVALEGGQRGRGRVPVPGEAHLQLMAGQWGIDARHLVGNVTPVDVVLMGRLQGEDFADSTVTGTLTASESDLQAILQMLAESGLLSVQQDLVTGSIRARANVEGTIRKPVLHLAVESDEAAVSGQEVVNVQARGRLEGSTFDLEELSAVQPSASSTEASPGRVRASGQLDLTSQGYTGNVSASSWRIVPTADLPLSGLVGVDFSGRGRGRMVYGKGRIVSDLTFSRDIALGEIVADIDLQGDHANLVARAPEFNLALDGSVRLDTPYQTSLRANAKALDLARAVSGAALPVAIDGTADIHLEAEGPIEQWRDGRASLEVTTLDGRVQTLPVALREPARAKYDSGRLFVERLEASIGKTLLSVAGALPVSRADGNAVLATLTGDLYDVAVAAAVAVDTSRTTPQAPIVAGRGPLALLARITGSIESPTYAADLEVGPGMVQVRSDLAPVENFEVRAHLEDGVIDLRNLAGTFHGANVNATGRAPLALLTGATPAPSEGEAALRASAVGVTAAVLAPFVDASTISQIGGSLDAKLDLTSASLDLEDVEGELTLDRLDLTMADLPVSQRMPTRIIARDGVARIESWSWESEGTSLDVSGQVHLGSQQAAILATGRLDARLITPFLGTPDISTAGQVDTRVSVTGSVTEPTINGDVRLANGEIRMREPRIVAGNLSAAAVLARNNVFITSLSGMVNGGTLSGSGQIQYTPDLRGNFSANVTRMAMDFPRGLRTEVDSSIELTTTAKEGAPANRLSGLVTIRRGAYREPLALLTGVLTNLQRTGTTTGSAPSPFLRSLTLDVSVITDEDIVIDNNVARAQLGADLRLINVASSPALSGRAELREGGQLFLGTHTYFVESGTIDFANPSRIEPNLGIEATTRVSGVDIDVSITGPPDTLMTELTSSSHPDLGQADLTSLLLTGRRMDQLTEEQAATVGAQVLGNLAGDVLGFAGRAVGLDTLRVGAEANPRDPADLASETDPTSRVTFGKSFGAGVDVTFSQSLVKSNAQTFILDYLPIRRLALRFVQDDDDLRSYALRHDLTFGTAPNTIRSGDTSREIEQPRVSSIQLMGDLGFPEDEVRNVLRLTVGNRFDFINWQEDRDRLERFFRARRHLAARIAANRDEIAEGVVLTYTVEAGPETLIRVTGMTLPGSALREIETVWTQSVYEGFLIEEVEGIVRRELALQAVYQPSLEVRVEGNDALRTLVIDVTPGPRADRIEIRFDGLDEQLRSDLLDEVGQRSHAVQALSDPREYERTVVAALRSRGYAQASVTVGVPVFEEARATVPVTVDPGPRFRFGAISFEGAGSIAVAELRTEARLEDGAIYRSEEVEDARLRVEARYVGDGFTTAAVDAREEVRATDGLVDVVFAVREGPRQVIQEIAISGLQSVDEDIVTRTLRLRVGDSLRTADWLEARRRLFESGLFRRVGIDVEPVESAPPETTPVVLRVVVEEWPALRLRYGFQVAEERPEENVEGRDLVPGVSGDLTRRTLFGRAITVGVAGQYERSERLGRLFMNTPTLLNWPIQSALTLERSREESRTVTLVTDRTTAAWEQRARFGNVSLSYALRFERNHTFDTDPPDPNLPFDLTVHIGRLTSAATWDSRDDPSDSTRGTFVSTSLEHATSRLGSDLLFLRSLTQAYHFRPWKGVVFASALRYGAVEPLGGQVLSRANRFFAGGARTVRGVADDSLGGLDFLGQPIGGRGLLTLNQEVRFPLYRWFRGVVFVDAGNVFPEVSGVRLGGLVGSTGFGLRLVTPVALFRLDYGKTIWNRPVDDSGRIVFGIGQTF